VLLGDKGKPEKLACMTSNGKCDPARRKRSGRGSGKRMMPSGVRCMPDSGCNIGFF